MKNLIRILAVLFCVHGSGCGVEPVSAGSAQFTPPEGWHFAESIPESLKYLRLMVIGKSDFELPPSISLATEEFKGNSKQYSSLIKKISSSKGGDLRDLGKIKTQAGEASLFQEDTKTNWGDLRMMHLILIKDGTAYIMTTAALKKEFSKFYNDFFKSMRSLKITS